MKFAKLNAFFAFLLLPLYGISQVIPAHRTYDWSIAGNQHAENYESDTLNILAFGGKGSGSTYNDAAYDSALDALNGKAGVIFFPAGDYSFQSVLKLPDSTVIKGAGSGQTTLTFDTKKPSDLISIKGRSKGGFRDTLGDQQKRSGKLIVPNGALYQSGDDLEFIQDNGKLATSGWAQGHLGQIIHVENVKGDTLVLEQPLRMNFYAHLNPRLRKIKPVTHSGVECMKIIRNNQTTNQTSNIHFRYAKNCWAKGIESYKCNFSHVEVSKSTHVEIRRSYFHHAFRYGGGGKAYGVTLHLTTGETLVENNIFEHLRHSMLLQASANGNVLAYNYSIDPHKSGFPSNFTGDLVLHGNYPYANLFEGNIVQSMVIDHSHGINGHHNTLFRNRGELYGIVMNNNPPTDSQNFVGNDLTGGIAQYLIRGRHHFEYGNNFKGNIRPSGTGDLKDTSYYRESSPYYWLQDIDWPSIGVPKSNGSGSIPAKERYATGDLAPCTLDNIKRKPTYRDPVKNGTGKMRIFPNPCHNTTTINIPAHSGKGRKTLYLFDNSGKLLRQKTFGDQSVQLALAQLPAGNYWVGVKSNGGYYLQQVIKQGK